MNTNFKNYQKENPRPKGVSCWKVGDLVWNPLRKKNVRVVRVKWQPETLYSRGGWIVSVAGFAQTDWKFKPAR